MIKYFTAIAFDYNGKPFKYRNIKNVSANLRRFESFLETKNIVYINYYCKQTKNFVVREYLNKKLN